MSETTKYFATYVHRRRRPASGIFDADLPFKKDYAGNWELAAVFGASGEAIELDPRHPENRPSYLVVDGERRTAKQLLGGETLPSVKRVWTKPTGSGPMTEYVEVYIERDYGTAEFGGSAWCSRGSAIVPLHYDLVAIFKVIGRRDLWLNFNRPYGKTPLIDLGDQKWTAQQLIDGQGGDWITRVWPEPVND